MDDYHGPAPDQDEAITGQPDSGYVRPDSGYEKPKRDLGDTPRKSRPRRSRRSAWACFVLLGCLISPCVCCVMALCTVGSGVGIVAAIFDSNKVTRTTTRTFDVEAGAALSLEIDNRVGSITVQPGSADDEVAVTYKMTAYGFTRDAAESNLDEIAVDIRHDENSRMVINVDPGSSEDSWFFRASSVNLTVSVPDEVYLTLENNVGNITIEDVTVRALNVRTNTGEVSFNGRLAETVEDSLTLETNVGSLDVTLPDDVYLVVEAEADVGNVNVADGFDRVSVEEQGSDDRVGDHQWITLGEGPGDAPTLLLKINVGDVSIRAR